MSASSTFLVAFDGAALPADVAPLLTSGFVDDSQQLPDLFSLRFRDPDRIVLAKSNAKIGSTATVSVQVSDAAAPEVLIKGEVTAVELEFDAGGTFTVIRGYDQAHRLFRGRRTASYVQMTASDIAVKVAQRAGLRVGAVSATRTVFPHVSQAGQTDWQLLSLLARDTGFEVAVRDGAFSFGPPTQAASAPSSGGPASTDPLVVMLGRDLLRLRSLVTSAQQVEEVEVRGWDVATKQALTTTKPAKTDTVQLPTVDPVALARTFGGAVLVATDVPYRTQAEVDEAATALAADAASTFAELEGVARGNPKLRAGAAITLDGAGPPFDGKYTITTSRHRIDPGTGYTTTFRVTGRHDRSLLGLTSGGAGAAASGGPVGPVVAQVTDVADPEKQGRVRVSYPWLSADYVSDWARTLQPGAGHDRGWTVLPEVGDEVLVTFEQADVSRPVVLGGLVNGVDGISAGPADLVDAGSGAVNRRSLVSRLGHRLDLLDQSGRKDGIRLATTDDKLLLDLDAGQTKLTVHADGTVLVEGSRGVTIDAADAAMELRGGQIALKATNGVTVDGGGGAVSVKSGAQLSLSGLTAKLEGSTQTEVKGGALCSVSATLVRIN